MSTITKKSVSNFENWKKQNKDEFIRRKSKELMFENPDLTLKDLAKKFKCSDATVSRAFDMRTIPEKEIKKAKVDFSGILNTLLKGGIGLGGISVLNSPTLMKNLQEDVEKFLIDNRYLNYAIIGLGIIWEKFVKVKIVEGGSTEIEVILRLIESNFSYIMLVVLGIAFLIGNIPNILTFIEDYFVKWKTTIPNKIKDVTDGITQATADIFEIDLNPEIAENGQIFPSYVKWRDIFYKRDTLKPEFQLPYTDYFDKNIMLFWGTSLTGFKKCKAYFMKNNPYVSTPLTQAEAQYIDETNEQMQNEDWMNSAKWNV